MSGLMAHYAFVRWWIRRLRPSGLICYMHDPQFHGNGEA